MLKYERFSIKMNFVCEKQANPTVKKAETGKMTDYIQKIIHTDRLRTAYYRAGEGNEKKLVVLHGNISSSVFFLPGSHGELVPLTPSLLKLLFVLFVICCIPLT